MDLPKPGSQHYRILLATHCRLWTYQQLYTRTFSVTLFGKLTTYPSIYADFTFGRLRPHINSLNRGIPVLNQDVFNHPTSLRAIASTVKEVTRSTL